jgi:hypothetical protein
MFLAFTKKPPVRLNLQLLNNPRYDIYAVTFRLCAKLREQILPRNPLWKTRIVMRNGDKASTASAAVNDLDTTAEPCEISSCR